LHARAFDSDREAVAAELADGGADEVLDGLRGEFDAAPWSSRTALRRSI
jgi:hypothetical protein